MRLKRDVGRALLVVAMSLGGTAVSAAAPGQPPAPLSHLASLLKLRNSQPVTITIVGFGSSVGVGATLPDPAVQAPVKYLGARLKAAFPAAKKLEVVCDNRSLNGSILSQFLNDVPTGNWNAYLKEGKKPTLVVFAYGMNDGFPAMYNASQPPPFFRSQLVAAIRLVQAAGADPVILTSPHPISTVAWAMPATYRQAYPTAVPAPVGPEQMSPPASRSVVLQDPLGTGRRIPVSVRHLHLNQLMREVARETGCAVIDAERCWFEAVAARGGDAALFNAGETVHPNLLGHQVSYQQAIDQFVASL
ncbi:MAG: SGNH/GDSL hydrolase family protein [Lentisphaeria bacterium]